MRMLSFDTDMVLWHRTLNPKCKEIFRSSCGYGVALVSRARFGGTIHGPDGGALL